MFCPGTMSSLTFREASVRYNRSATNVARLKHYRAGIQLGKAYAPG
ncbi:hypothetical protein TSMEX_002824 [Taenia solium]|eukprot:TsM_000353700 transcript=TsM_000353700 gene=TsM_000353700